MHRQDLIRLYPKLYHMAEATSWPLIQRHGLLSTAALLDLFEVPSRLREQLLYEHRPQSVKISHRKHGDAVIRDQKPLYPTRLDDLLDDGMTVPEFLGMLNHRVFFWLRASRLDTLLGARAYRDRPHLVITVDTERLLEAVGDEAVTMSRINSGSMVYNPVRRGPGTFSSIENYPHPPRQRPRKDGDVVELCVAWGVPNITEVADRAEIRGSDGQEQTLWCR